MNYKGLNTEIQGYKGDADGLRFKHRGTGIQRYKDDADDYESTEASPYQLTVYPDAYSIASVSLCLCVLN